MRRLREPECQRLLEEYRRPDGSPLTAKLASFGMSADQYLAWSPSSTERAARSARATSPSS